MQGPDSNSQDAELSRLTEELKGMIVEVCDKDIAPESISDEETLFGETARLELDSLDGLQISAEIQRRYGIRLSDPKEVRRLMTNVRTLAHYIAGRT